MNELKLTNTERMIMEVIWQEGELSNTDIFNRIGEAHNWSRHMVKFATSNKHQSSPSRPAFLKNGR